MRRKGGDFRGRKTFQKQWEKARFHKKERREKMKKVLAFCGLLGIVLGLVALAAEPWTQGPSLNVARYKCRALVLDGKIYVIGGRDPKNTAPIEVFDPALGKWEIVGPLSR
jgi:hypothetical protein